MDHKLCNNFALRHCLIALTWSQDACSPSKLSFLLVQVLVSFTSLHTLHISASTRIQRCSKHAFCHLTGSHREGVLQAALLPWHESNFAISTASHPASRDFAIQIWLGQQHAAKSLLCFASEQAVRCTAVLIAGQYSRGSMLAGDTQLFEQPVNSLPQLPYFAARLQLLLHLHSSSSSCRLVYLGLIFMMCQDLGSSTAGTASGCPPEPAVRLSEQAVLLQMRCACRSIKACHMPARQMCCRLL